MAMPKCMAQFQKVSMEMTKNEKAGKMTSDGLCDGFEGFTTHCKKADYDATDKNMKPTDSDGEMTYDGILGMKNERCSACGKGFMELAAKMNSGNEQSGRALSGLMRRLGESAPP